jgi:hypothetical protein
MASGWPQSRSPWRRTAAGARRRKPRRLQGARSCHVCMSNRQQHRHMLGKQGAASCRNMPAAGYYGSLHTGEASSSHARQAACSAACWLSHVHAHPQPHICACSHESAHAASAGDPLHELQRLNTQMYLAEREQQSSQLLWPPGPAYQPDFAHQEQPAPTPWWRQPAGATSQVPCMACSMSLALPQACRCRAAARQVIGLSGRHAMQAPSAGTTRPPLRRVQTAVRLCSVAAQCGAPRSKARPAAPPAKTRPAC